MKKILLLILLLPNVLLANSSTSGEITEIQIAIDHQNVYFKLDNMPSGVNKWFFFSPNQSGSYKECPYTGNENRMQRSYAALLAAKAQNKTITIGYCQASDGYGLVNGFIRINS